MLESAITTHDLFAMANAALEDGLAGAAEDLLLRARKLAVIMNSGAQSVDQAEASLALARLYNSLGEGGHADAYYDEAFIIFSKLLGETHEMTKAVQAEYGLKLTLELLAAERRKQSTN